MTTSGKNDCAFIARRGKNVSTPSVPCGKKRYFLKPTPNTVLHRRYSLSAAQYCRARVVPFVLIGFVFIIENQLNHDFRK
jgi:hypothetical protein